ncbi:hypothetical protein [Flavobacterium pedocola]
MITWMVCQSPIYSQSKLEQSKKELNSGSQSTSPNTTSSRSGHTTSGKGFFQLLFVDIVYGTFKYGLIGDYQNENHLHSNLTPYPYYNKISGNFEGNDTLTLANKNRWRIDLDDHFMYSNSDLYGNHLKVKIRPFQYFYLQTDCRQLYESNETSTHQLSLFHFNVVYDRLRFEKLNLGWTLGASYVGNEVKKVGFSYGLTADYFMNRQISFSGNAKWSKINGLSVNAYELLGKYHIKRGFVGLGYQHIKIATPSYNFITLGGGIYF